MTAETASHNQLLVRVADLRLDVRARAVDVRAGGSRTRHDDYVLRILDYFSTPHSLADAMKALWTPDRGAVRWREVSSTILALQRAGVLAAPSAAAGAGSATPGARAVALHVRMLNDTVRTRAYLDAIAATVRPGDVVVDVGTGTGILAMAAARAGARRVYAIEAAAIADMAQAMFNRNGFGDRITLMRGWSTCVTLPERADVMVAELVGMDPFDELIGEITTDAIARLLTDRARLVPSAVRVMAIPVTVSDAHQGHAAFTPASAARWKDLYGFDFSPTVDLSRNLSLSLGLKPNEARGLARLAEPVAVATMDFRTPISGLVDYRGTATATADGLVTGVLLYFDLSLAPGHTLTTAPDVADDNNHWGNRVLTLGEPLRVRAGDTFFVRIERRCGRFAAWCDAAAQD